MKHSEDFTALIEKKRGSVAEISTEKVEPLIAKGAALIDVREESEFKKGYISGALHIGKGVLERDICKHFPDKSRMLILYCGGGMRSILAACALQEMGYESVFSLTGGWRAWQEQGLSTEVSPPESGG